MSPSQRYSKLAPNRRQALLAAATREFALRGYEGASLAAIAQAAGFTKGSLYYYFADKADLFAEVLGEAIAGAGLGLDPASLTREGFWSALERFSQSFLDEVERRPEILGLGRAYYGLSAADREAPAISAQWGRLRRWMVDVATRGQALGVVRRDLPVALVAEVCLGIGAAVDAWTVSHLDAFPPEALATLNAKVIEMFRLVSLPPGAQEEP